MAKGLTLKQRKFVAAYLKSLNATQAAISSGYGKTYDSSAQLGKRLLENPAVAAAVGQVAEKVTTEAGITTAWVLKGIKSVGDDPKANRVEKLKAYELGGKYLKLFVEKHEHSGPGGQPLTFTINLGPGRE